MPTSAAAVDDLHALVTASDLSLAWEHFERALTRCGFPRLVYGLTTGLTRRTIGRPDEITLFHNMPVEWIGEAIGGRLFERSPAVRWARRNSGGMPWGRLSGVNLSGRLGALNERHGITAGVSFSFSPTSLGARAMLCMMTEPYAQQGKANLAWDRHRCEIEALATTFHLRVLTLPRETVEPTLNRRHCEVLACIGAGLSVVETADRIGRTAKAVEKRLAEARRVLSANSTAEAVLRAAEMNLISTFGLRPAVIEAA